MVIHVAYRISDGCLQYYLSFLANTRALLPLEFSLFVALNM